MKNHHCSYPCEYCKISFVFKVEQVKMTNNQEHDDKVSCDKDLSRKEFLNKILKGAALFGGLMAAPKVVDSFIAPASAAGLSSCNAADTSSSVSMQDFATAGNTDVNTLPGSDTLCSHGD
jgi:hypothetical protein